MFDCDDIIGEHAVKVRFEWYADAFSPTWRQSFSYDSGSTWKLNWEMAFSRNDEADGQEHTARPAQSPGQTEAAQTG